jgi:hypothetical protein
MKYMLLIYSDPTREPAYGTPEFQAMMGGYFAFNEKLKADGVSFEGEGLQGIDAGKVETMDGPFAETREHLGGYYILDVADLDKALAYAALIPSAPYGTVEVRPLMNYNPAG